MEVTADLIAKLLEAAEKSYDFLTVDDIEFYIPGATKNSDFYSSIIYILENKLGVLIFKNDEDAIDLYKNLADEGEVKYQFLLGKIYFDGLIVKSNWNTAQEYFLKAKKNDHLEASYYLAEMFLTTDNKEAKEVALTELMIIAEKGSVKAQCRLAEIFGWGLYGVKINLDKAHYACNQAVKQKFPKSFLIFAKLCSIGGGENNEYDHILPFLRLAAEFGEVEAQGLLFEILKNEEGESVYEKQSKCIIKRQLNLFESLAWAEIAAKGSMRGDLAASDFLNEQAKIIKDKLSQTEIKQSNLIRDDLLKKIENNKNNTFAKKLTGIDLNSI